MPMKQVANVMHPHFVSADHNQQARNQLAK